LRRGMQSHFPSFPPVLLFVYLRVEHLSPDISERSDTPSRIVQTKPLLILPAVQIDITGCEQGIEIYGFDRTLP